MDQLRIWLGRGPRGGKEAAFRVIAKACDLSVVRIWKLFSYRRIANPQDDLIQRLDRFDRKYRVKLLKLAKDIGFFQAPPVTGETESERIERLAHAGDLEARAAVDIAFARARSGKKWEASVEPNEHGQTCIFS